MVKESRYFNFILYFMIQVVLTKVVPKLGRRGEPKNVKDGFYRNFLLPRGLAVVATPGRLKEAQVRMAKMVLEREQIKSQMNEVLEKLSASVLRFQKKTTSTGKLYAAITPKQLVEALEEQLHLSLKPENILLDEPLKAVGTFTIHLQLAEDFSASLKVEIAALEK